jgi:DNA-binding PadR family transcriptional regulator
MSRSDSLGAFEQLVLLALLRLGRDAYGMTVRREICSRTGREVSLGAVYATLDRMEAKGLVRSREVEGDQRRGGRARRFFEIQARGRRALTETLASLDRLRADLPGLSPFPQPA